MAPARGGCDERLAVSKRGELAELPFPIVDDGIELRPPIVGVVAGLRAAAHELVVVVLVDCPLLDAQEGPGRARRSLCRRGAVPPSGPLPGAYRKSALPVLEQRVELDPTRLANANTPAELAAVGRQLGL